MKSLLRSLAAAALLLPLLLCPAGAAAEEVADTGGYVATYTAVQFSDVDPSDWFAPCVEVCATEGLLQGGGDGTFNPRGMVNADEALVMAARVLWQAEGNALPLPKGPSAEAFTAATGEQYSSMTTWHGTWAWDGISYFWSRVTQTGASLPLPVNLQEPAIRWQFFSWLAFAAQGLDLNGINPVDALPDTENEAILGLYRAGILTGTDHYGTFSGTRTLTRSEAAALLARLARPELRQRFTPLPAPKTGYSLTHLADGAPNWGCSTRLCGLEDGFLTLEGEVAPFPGNGPSSSLGPAGDYFHIEVYIEETQNPYDTYGNLLGADGQPVIPFGTYDDLSPMGDGQFLARRRDGNGETQYFLLRSDGSLALTLPTLGEGMTPIDGWTGFNEGLLPCRDTATGLWGYVDATGVWAIEPHWTGSVWSFSGGYATLCDDHGRWGLIDRAGNLVLPFQYQSIDTPHNSPGYSGEPVFSCIDAEGQLLWVNLRGESRPRPEGSEYRYPKNGYLDNGTQYFDLAGNPVSEVFDWAGPMGPDGRGFVGKEGAIYRIQFDT